MTQFFCPSCGNKVNKTTGISYDPRINCCTCGMSWFNITSTKGIKVDSDPKISEMRKALEDTLVAFHVKRDENENIRRDKARDKAIEWLLSELLKGPIKGGTLSDVIYECQTFGSDLWVALQKAILIRDPMCKICNQRPSREVHHIRPRHYGGKNHPRNLVGLCLECHDEVHRKIDLGVQRTLEKSLDIKIQTTLEEKVEEE